MTLLDDADAIVHDGSAIAEPPPSLNCVHVVGKVSQPLQTKDLPSGDVLGKWNLVVSRPKPVAPVRPSGSVESDGSVEVLLERPTGVAAPRRQSHDTLECISFDRAVIERLSGVEAGAWLELHGALRRRFRDGSEGRQSSYNIEALTVAVVWTPPAPEAAAIEPAEPIAGEAAVTAAE